MNLKTLFAVAIGCSLSVIHVPAQTAGLDVVQFSQLIRDYNLGTFGDANLTMIQNDTEGPLAVGGNLNIGGVPLVNLQHFSASSDPTLYVKGTLSVASGSTANLNDGYASLPGMANAGNWDGIQKRYTTPAGGILSTANAAGGNVNSTLDPRTNPAPVSWNFATMKSSAVSISNNLAGLPANGAIAVNGQNLTFNAGTNTGVVIFNLNANLLNGNLYNNQTFSNISMNIPVNTEFVVNVLNAGGKTLFGTGNGVNFNLPGGAAGVSQLLWNIVNAGPSDITTTLGNGGQFYGSVLAPMVTLANAATSPLNGQILADSVTYTNAELHYTKFVAIPEPADWTVVMGVALLGMLAVRRHKRAV